MHTFQFCPNLREAPGENTHLSISQRRLEFSRLKLSEIRMCLYYKNKAKGGIFDEKV